MSDSCMYCKEAEARHQPVTRACPLWNKEHRKFVGWCVTTFKVCAHAVQLPIKGGMQRCMSCGRKSTLPASTKAA